ncbi:Uncharacterised protein [Bordetella pertussis]|nr:Uncharacterised protein [Bordetella pertussis]
MRQDAATTVRRGLVPDVPETLRMRFACAGFCTLQIRVPMHTPPCQIPFA